MSVTRDMSDAPPPSANLKKSEEELAVAEALRSPSTA